MPKTEKHDIHVFRLDHDGNVAGHRGIGGYTQQECEKWLKADDADGDFVFMREVCRRKATPIHSTRVSEL